MAKSVMCSMEDPKTTPDDLFVSEFGSGDLSKRLWRGGLRVDVDGYRLERSAHTLATCLSDGLDSHVSETAITSIIDDIEACWNDVARMRRACTPMPSKARSLSALPLSLAKIILSIDVFQPPMINCVVNKISELGEESAPDKQVAVMLLNQLRWLDFIVDGTALCENLLAVVPIVSPYMQKALIEALPEILDDSSREEAVTELVKILEQNPSMMGSIVDALGALGVDDSRLADVNSSILSTIAAVNRDVLPVSLKYLLRTCPQNLLPETVTAIRHTLALPSLGPAYGKLCLDAVRAGLRMSKLVADHVLKTLRKFEKPTDHKPADLWLLLALFDSPLHRKNAEVLFRKKAANGMFSCTLFDAALAPFADAFHGMTDRLIEMACIAVKASEIGARRTGVLLYSLLFHLFDSGSTRRNVVSALLNHTGTRKPSEVDAALETLALIAQKAVPDRSLLPHSASIQGLLDFLESFTDPQLRQIWTVLGYLCRAAKNSSEESTTHNAASTRQSIGSVQDLDMEQTDRGEAELNMLQILLRKELTHSETFYRRIGVVGACTMIKVLGSDVKNGILAMLLEVGKSHPYSQAVAFDELAEVFCDGDPGTKENAESIRKTISAFFERKYVTEKAGLGGLVKDENLLAADFYGSLEGDDIEFCISISSLIRKEQSLKESQDAVRSIVPNLRLLCVMTATRYDGSLSEVDAIIGAPLHLPLVPSSKDMEDLSSSAKGDLLLSLLVAHGWVVELINAFAEQSNAELRAKCVRRVDNLLDLSSKISAVVPLLPVWSDVMFDMYNGTQKSAMIRSEGKKKPKGKKNKNGLSFNAGYQGNQDWTRYARQLNATALSLIRVTEPISWRLTETESETVPNGQPTMESASLSTEGLLFLLKQLSRQIDGLVGSDVRNQQALSICLTGSSSSGINAEGQRSLSESTADGILKRFIALRTALTSLGPQLARCLKKVFSKEPDINEDEGDVGLDSYLSCMTLCLHTLAKCLNSSILSEAVSQDLLFRILASVRLDGEPCAQPSDPLTTGDIHAAAKLAFGQLHQKLESILSGSQIADDSEEYTPEASVLKFDGCVAFLAAMDSIFLHCSERAQLQNGPGFSKVAFTILEHRWDVASLRAKKTQKVILGVVRIFVQFSSDPISAAEDLKSQIVALAENEKALERQPVDTQNTGEGSQPGRLGSLGEHTAYVFTVSILEQYLWLFKSFQPKEFPNVEAAFARMERLMSAELPLYNLARKNQRTLGPVMRAGRTFVDLFLKTCLPFLKEHFQEHRSSVVQLCRTHQKPTRVLQTYCAHSKSVRDTSLTGLVPPLRKSLELLLYRVKDLLQSHNATDAFQLGNLKHRDINGEVLASQQMQYKSESEKESEYGSEEETDDDRDESEDPAPRRLQNQVLRENAPNERESTKRATSTNSLNVSRGVKRRKTTKTGAAGPPATPDENIGGGRRQRKTFGGRDSKQKQSPKVSAKQEDSGGSPVGPRRRRRRNLVREEETERVRGHNPLIDDEAEDEDGEEEEAEYDGTDDLSQFLVFGDEEEEEES